MRFTALGRWEWKLSLSMVVNHEIVEKAGIGGYKTESLGRTPVKVCGFLQASGREGGWVGLEVGTWGGGASRFSTYFWFGADVSFVLLSLGCF